MEDNTPTDLSISRLKKAQKEIIEFDATLESIEMLFPGNEQMCDFINNTRDCLFRLQQAMRGLKIIDNSRLYEEPLLDLKERRENQNNIL
jgi:hypothetical protein